MKPSEILEKAKSLLTEETWGQGSERRAQGKMCAAEAIHSFLVTDQWSAETAYKRLRDQCDGSIPDWNDTPGRTLAEVHAAFDKAIELAKAEGE